MSPHLGGQWNHIETCSGVLCLTSEASSASEMRTAASSNVSIIQRIMTEHVSTTHSLSSSIYNLVVKLRHSILHAQRLKHIFPHVVKETKPRDAFNDGTNQSPAMSTVIEPGPYKIKHHQILFHNNNAGFNFGGINFRRGTDLACTLSHLRKIF